MDESILNKKWMLFLNSFFQFIFLNLLWLLFSLPLITFWPATAALFGVVRKWIRKEEIDTFHTFKRLFKENFASSLLTGVIWSFLTLVLFLDFYFINRITSSFSWLGLVLFGVAGSLFIFTSVYLLPVMVHFRTSTQGVWKNSLVIAMMHPFMTIIIILIGCISTYFLVKFPILIFGVGSLIAYYQYNVINRIFEKLELENGKK
ncbi:YesL family protein [Neobacillus sp. D3-1R]|uniref:YesL family protein n=1 Tax=Neobacillus sp. D3-1R TaxID=3445778 RepID=UPI003FA14AF6